MRDPEQKGGKVSEQLSEQEKFINSFISKHASGMPEHVKESLRKRLEKVDVTASIDWFFMNRLDVVLELCKGIKIGRAIKGAEEKGFFEEAEHLTSQIDLDTDEEKT